MEGIYKLPIDYKLDDIDIFAWKGVELSNNIVIQQLKAYDWFYVYLPYMQKMINILGNMFPGITLDEGYAENKNFIFIAITNKIFKKHYFKLLEKLKIFKCRNNKILKLIKMEMLIDTFFLLYLFNTDGLKKKLKYRIDQVFIQKSPTSGTSSTNAKNMGGCKIVDKIIRPPKRSKT